MATTRYRNGKIWASQNTAIPWFAAAGHFKHRKGSLELISYSGFLIYEIIYVLESDQEVVRETLMSNPYVYAVFKNAAGTGLYFIVKIDDHHTNHQSNFWKVKSCFQEYLDTQRISIKGEALDYFTQFSWDPDLYMNLDASAYPNWRTF